MALWRRRAFKFVWWCRLPAIATLMWFSLVESAQDNDAWQLLTAILGLLLLIDISLTETIQESEQNIIFGQGKLIEALYRVVRAQKEQINEKRETAQKAEGVGDTHH